MAKDVKEKAAVYLANHRGVDALYSTSDGYLFEVKQHAVAHSSTLEDATVEKHVPPAKGETAGGGEPPTPKGEATEPKGETTEPKEEAAEPKVEAAKEDGKPAAKKRAAKKK